jgi:hypothetical protein
MDISCEFLKQVGLNKWQVGLLLVEFQKIVPNKQVGWKKCKNANRVDSFIWHPRVTYLLFTGNIYSPS